MQDHGSFSGSINLTTGFQFHRHGIGFCNSSVQQCVALISYWCKWSLKCAFTGLAKHGLAIYHHLTVFHLLFIRFHGEGPFPVLSGFDFQLFTTNAPASFYHIDLIKPATGKLLFF